VSIWANKTSNIPANNSSRATVYARVQYPDGTKAKGQNVYWGKSRGSLDHGATKTNSSGVATNRIRSGSAGTSRVTASYGGTSKSINIKFKTTSETRYDNNNYVSSAWGINKTMRECYHIVKPGEWYGDKAGLHWGGRKISSLSKGEYDRGYKDVGSYRYSWNKSKNKKETYYNTCGFTNFPEVYYVNIYSSAITRIKK